MSLISKILASPAAGSIGKVLRGATRGGTVLGAAYAGSEVLQAKAGQMRAYVGEAEYNEKYKTGTATTQGILKGAGYIFGGSAAFLGFGKTAKYTAGAAGAGAALFTAGSFFHHTISGPVGGGQNLLFGAATAGALGALATPLGRKIASNKYFVGGSAATLAGGYLGSQTTMYPAAEGNITSVTSSSSPSRRMNFSTAGLTTALHRNRKL